MTARRNATIAGGAYLLYIAAAIPSFILFARAAEGDAMAAKLANVAQHAPDMRVIVVLGLVSALSAVVLAVTLYAITRDEDRDLAMLGLTCRLVEAVIVALSIETTLSVLWLATATGSDAPETGAAHALAAYFLRGDPALPGTFFAMGSLLFSYLLLRGRMIPMMLALLGVTASLLLVVILPLGLAGWLTGPIMSVVWLPMLVFEVIVAFWLIIKGVEPPRRVKPA